MDEERIHLGGTARSLEDVRVLHELGLQFVEIPIKRPDEILPLIPVYQKLKEELGLYYLCHGAREGDPNDLESLKKVYLPKIMRTLSIMPEFGMGLLTIHLWLDPRFVKEESIDFKIGLLKEIIERAAEEGITVCLENLSENARHMARVFDSLPQLGLTLDLGHAQLMTEVSSSFGFMESYPDRIKHIHLHDNLGGDSPKDDLHLLVGKGVVDFKAIFAKLEKTDYNGTVTIELKPSEIRENLSYIKELLFRRHET